MVGIIDFNAGNITSLERALEYLGIKYLRSKNPLELTECDRFMFPGDGDDSYAMAELKKRGFEFLNLPELFELRNKSGKFAQPMWSIVN